MEEFYVDKIGNDCEENQSTSTKKNDDDEDEFLNNEKIVSDLFDGVLDKFQHKETKLKKNEFRFDDTYIITSYKGINKKENVSPEVDKLLQKSKIKLGLEKQHRIAPEKSKKALIAIRKRLGQKTKGEKWFNMPATRLTEEIKTDLELLRMRSVLDRKHVYKKNDITKIPKYFQVGKIIESPADFYGGRIPKSQRKKTMVDELLADAEFKKYQKKKFKEIMDENRRKKQTKKNSNKLREGKPQKKKSIEGKPQKKKSIEGKPQKKKSIEGKPQKKKSKR